MKCCIQLIQRMSLFNLHSILFYFLYISRISYAAPTTYIKTKLDEFFYMYVSVTIFINN